MNEEVIMKMLNEIPVVDFLAYFAWGTIAMLVVFGLGVNINAKKTGWHWRAFWNGWKRILINLVLIAMGIVFWPNLSQFLFSSETVIELTMWSSLLLGLSLDRLRSWIKSMSTKEKK